MHFRRWVFLFVAFLVASESLRAQVPPANEIYSRFGVGKPGKPIDGFVDGRFTMNRDEVVVFVGQENLVREQKSGVMEAMLAAGFAKQKPK